MEIGIKIATDQKLHTLTKGTRVKLKEEVADVYGHAYSGSEAIVKNLGIDIGDFPMIYIEWDKKDWQYNGESDMWTFENHFEPVVKQEKANMTDKSSSDEILKKLGEVLIPYLSSSDKPVSEPKVEPEPEHTEHEHNFRLKLTEDADSYVSNIEEAFEAVSESEAFIVLAVKAVNDPLLPGHTVLVPEPFIGYTSEQAGYTMHLAIAEIAASLHNEAVARILYDKMKQENES